MSTRGLKYWGCILEDYSFHQVTTSCILRDQTLCHKIFSLNSNNILHWEFSRRLVKVVRLNWVFRPGICDVPSLIGAQCLRHEVISSLRERYVYHATFLDQQRYCTGMTWSFLEISRRTPPAAPQQQLVRATTVYSQSHGLLWDSGVFRTCTHLRSSVYGGCKAVNPDRNFARTRPSYYANQSQKARPTVWPDSVRFSRDLPPSPSCTVTPYSRNEHQVRWTLTTETNSVNFVRKVMYKGNDVRRTSLVVKVDSSYLRVTGFIAEYAADTCRKP